jgi:hypothetical protein
VLPVANFWNVSEAGLMQLVQSGRNGLLKEEADRRLIKVKKQPVLLISIMIILFCYVATAEITKRLPGRYIRSVH